MAVAIITRTRLAEPSSSPLPSDGLPGTSLPGTSLSGASLPDPVPDPSTQAPSPACLDNDLCAFVYHTTGLGWLADTGFYLLLKPVRIILIIVVALVLRRAAHRLIRRLVRSGTYGDPTELLRPLRARMSTSLQETTGLRSERRRQRAEALGSVLRSVASVTIFTLTVMLILGELGVQLAPLIASAGIVGVALGFGAQNLVKDFIAGLSMLLEDQYGVGDVIDAGEASGTVEAIGLRITTIRDARGVLWYIRNGEIARVGNKSQGWALVVVDIPIGTADVAETDRVLREATATFADDPEFAPDLLDAPEVLGIEEITIDGPVVRTIVRTTSEKQLRLARELRRRLAEALAAAGITARVVTGPGLESGLGSGLASATGPVAPSRHPPIDMPAPPGPATGPADGGTRSAA